MNQKKFRFYTTEKQTQHYKRIRRGIIFILIMICVVFFFFMGKHSYTIETINSYFYQELKAPKREIFPIQDGEKICYLTFDDGPSKNTIKILDILKKYNAKATFFVIGNCLCEETEPIMERIVKEGHAVGLHAYNHVYESFYASSSSYLKDYEKLYKVLKEEYGIDTALIRFPGGSACKYSYQKGAEYVDCMRKLGFSCFDWNVTGEDSVGTPTIESIQKNVFERVFQYDTPIVLLHDSCIADMTVEALPGILEKLTEEGYKFASLEHRKEYVFKQNRKRE